MYYIAILALIGLDWLTKYWIQTSMALNDTIPVIDGIFHITYIHNYGAAFSILQGKQSFLLIVTGIAMTAILAYMVIGQIRKKAAPMELWSLALILAGVLISLWFADLCKCKNLCGIAAIIFILCIIRERNTSVSIYMYAILRTVETLVGVFAAWFANTFFFRHHSTNAPAK